VRPVADVRPLLLRRDLVDVPVDPLGRMTLPQLAGEAQTIYTGLQCEDRTGRRQLVVRVARLVIGRRMAARRRRLCGDPHEAYSR